MRLAEHDGGLGREPSTGFRASAALGLRFSSGQLDVKNAAGGRHPLRRSRPDARRGTLVAAHHFGRMEQ